MKIEIPLQRAESATISDFWRKHGANGCSMLAQPVSRNGIYILKIRLCTAAEADSINSFLDDLWKNEKHE